ncbi:MAG: hypothetical protein Kow0031_08060 [Anaerolineae bacterium]
MELSQFFSNEVLISLITAIVVGLVGLLVSLRLVESNSRLKAKLGESSATLPGAAQPDTATTDAPSGLNVTESARNNNKRRRRTRRDRKRNRRK